MEKEYGNTFIALELFDGVFVSTGALIERDEFYAVVTQSHHDDWHVSRILSISQTKVTHSQESLTNWRI